MAWIFLLLIPFEFSYSKTKLYELADLEKLAERNHYNEFLDHHLDILPSKRNENYDQLLLKMVLAKGKDLSEKEKLTQSEYDEYSLWTQNNQILNNEFYQNMMRTLMIKHSKYCFENRPYLNCEKAILHLWPKLKNHELSLSLYPIIEPSFNKEIERTLANTISFDGNVHILEIISAPALKHPMSEYYCKRSVFDSIIKKHIINAPNNLKDFQNDINDKFHADCRKSLKNKISKWFFRSDLDLKGKFLNLIEDKDIKSYYSFLQVINNEPKQDAINKAWRDFAKLKDSADQRKKISRLILKDQEFDVSYLVEMPKPKKDILTKYLNKNFPEFFTQLKDLCLNSAKSYCQSI